MVPFLMAGQQLIGLSSYPGSQNRHDDADARPKSHRLLHTYVSYSIPMKLHKYSNPPFPAEDPELDVEAQFASHVVREAQKRIEKKRRLQCLSGWLWCKCMCRLFKIINLATIIYK